MANSEQFCLKQGLHSHNDILANIGGGMFEVGLATPTILCSYV